MLDSYKQVLQSSKQKLLELVCDIKDALQLCIDASLEHDIEKAKKARSILKNSHSKSNKIDNSIIETLALFSPEAKDLRVIVSHLKITSELSRVSDYVKSYAKKISLQIEIDSKIIQDDMRLLLQSTLNSLDIASRSIETESLQELEELYGDVNIEESRCDDLISVVQKTLLQHISSVEEVEDLISFTKTLRKLERISDRSVKIVNLSYFAQKGGKLKL